MIARGPPRWAFGAPHWLDWDVAAARAAQASPHEVPPLHGLLAAEAVRPGHPARDRARPARLALRRRPGRAAVVAPPARSRRTSARSPGCSRWRSSTGPTASRGCSATRTSTSGRAREVGDVAPCSTPTSSRIPLLRGGQLADPRGRAPAGRAALLRRAGEGRARRRPRRRAWWSTVLAATTAVAVLVTLRALDAEAIGPAGGAVPRADPGRGLHGRLGRRADRGRRGVGAGLPGRSSHPRRLWLGGAGRGCCSGLGVLMSYGMPLMGLVAIAVLVAGPVVAAAPGRRRGRPGGGARRSRPVGFCVVGRLPGAQASGTSTASPQDRPQAYWWYGDLACLVVCAGPAAAVAGWRAACATALSPRGAAARVRAAAGGSAAAGGRAGRRVRDEQGRGRADLAAVRAVADRCRVALLPPAGGAGGWRSRWWRPWWCSTSSTRPGEAPRSGAQLVRVGEGRAAPRRACTSAVKPSSAAARAGEATTCRTSPSR